MRRIQNFFHALMGINLVGRNSFNQKKGWKRILIIPFWYIFSLLCAILDLISFGRLISVILIFTSSNTRKLTEEELAIFIDLPSEINYLKSINVIENSWLARFGKWMNRFSSLGLGVGTTIHFSRHINTRNHSDLRWLVHEVAHTLQFKHRGIIYIPEALIAQQFSGYDFGGKEGLISAKKLRSFNPEQQADVFAMLILKKEKEHDLFSEIQNGNW